MNITEPWSWLKIISQTLSFGKKHSLQLKADIPEQPILCYMCTGSKSPTQEAEAAALEPSLAVARPGIHTVKQAPLYNRFCAQTGSHTASHEQGKYSVRNGEPFLRTFLSISATLSHASDLWDCSLEHYVLDGVR